MVDGRSFTAAQDFLVEVKSFWTTEIFPEIKAEYQNELENLSINNESLDLIDSVMSKSILFQFYAWIERHLQRLKYSGRYGIYKYIDGQREALRKSALNYDISSEWLELDKHIELPIYYTSADIHQHPGGLCGDELAGVVYERGARTTTPLMGSKHNDLHYRFTHLVKSQVNSPERILDMGCGFGKSTKPFYELFESSSVDAIDLSSPCLKLGAFEAAKSTNRRVLYRQINALQTDYDRGIFDLVTSTMLIHELPPKEIEEMFDEATRVLKPGGVMVHLDFYLFPDMFSRFIHYGHAKRNNEPYMEPWAEMDVIGMLEAKGLINIHVAPFAETKGVDASNYPYWRFPWTVISAEKPRL